MKAKRLSIIFSVFFLSFLVISINPVYAFSIGQDANLVLGQADFTSEGTGTTASSFENPFGVAVDSNGNVWVADSTNDRVLRFDAPFTNGQDAAIVLGQDDVTSNGLNRGGGTAAQANSFRGPEGLALDPNGNLWIADTGNHRIVRYDAPFTTFTDSADVVLGQALFTDETANRGARGQNTLSQPRGVASDAAGNVWVADLGNMRVLRFDTTNADTLAYTNGQNAAVVLGQGTSYTTNAINNGGKTTGFQLPFDVTVDSSNNLWVADTGNHRVVKFVEPFTNGKAAQLALGQPDTATGGSGATASGLNSPEGVASDAAGNIWVADFTNDRVLKYIAPSTSGIDATLVLGQADFTSVDADRGGTVAANTLETPRAIIVDSLGNLWVTDANNHRLLKYNAPVTATTSSSGGDTSAPTIGKSATGRQVVENGFSYQSNLGGFTELDADLGLTHMDSLKVAVGGMPDAPPGEIREDTREKLNQEGLGEVANTFDSISDVIDVLENFFNGPLPDAQPVAPESTDIPGMLDNLKDGLDESKINPESHSNPERATQINDLLDKIAQKIAQIQDAL